MIEEEYKDEMYFYNDSPSPKWEVAYCIDCTKTMSNCEGGNWLSSCSGVIFDAAKNSFGFCGTPDHATKRLCYYHNAYKCVTCGTLMCGGDCTNIAGIEDTCSSRKCSTCGIKGCQRCVPMISFKGVYDSYPPQYVGQVWKCHNNPNCI